MLKSKKLRICLQFLLSLWILYHLFVILIMPNAHSYMGRAFFNALAPYGNTFGFSSGWNFFSPNPAQTLYMRYVVHFEDESEEGEQELSEPLEGFFPAEKNQGTFDPRRRRELYMTHFILRDPRRVESLFVPYLCKSHPKASVVQVEFVVETVPPLDQVVTLKQESVTDLSKQIEFIKQEYSCHDE